MTAAPEPGRPLPGLAPIVLGPAEGTVDSRFREVAAVLGDRLAILTPGDRYSYAQLDALADTGAARLRSLLGADPEADAGPGGPVAILTGPSAGGLASVLAVLRSGRPVAVLDPLLPVARVRRLLAQSGAEAVLVDEENTARLAGLPGVPQLVPVATVAGAVPRPHHDGPAGDPSARVGPGDPATLVFTSGSTGTPKGVIHPHRSWLNETHAAHQGFGIDSEDRVLLCLPPAFAAGLTVYFFALLSGATLSVYDPRVHGIDGLREWIETTGCTTAHFTPSLLRSWLATLPARHTIPSLRLVTTCGEAVYRRDVAQLRRHLAPGARFTGWAGTSETGHIAFNPIRSEDPLPDPVIALGHPAANKLVRLVDENGVQVPVGSTGDVVVTSRYLALGYLGDPDSTADRFEFHDDGTTSYRTGDLASLDDAGVLRLHGRVDEAVKVRGYLVEPAEVEAALVATGIVHEAAVVARRRAVGGAEQVRLVAFVVPEPDGPLPRVHQVRALLRRQLPDWMMPTRIVPLQALPRTERDKVDRMALVEPEPATPVEAPRGPDEVLVARAWARVLGEEQPDRDRDFHEAGGDSLQAVRMLSVLTESTGLALSPADLAGAPTIGALAHVIRAMRHQRLQPATLGRLSGAGRDRLAATTVVLAEPIGHSPVFGFAGSGLGAYSLLPLQRELDLPMVGFQASGLEDRARTDWTVAAAARRHLADLRRFLPDEGDPGADPLVLIGHSFGGLVAIEVARRLLSEGRRAALVLLLDTPLTGPLRARSTAPPRRTPPARSAPGPAPETVAATGSDPLRTETTGLWRTRAELLLAGPVRFAPRRQQQLMHEQARRIVMVHRPGVWAGPTVLVRATDNDDEVDLWHQVAIGRFEVVESTGDHTSMLLSPHIATAAEAVRRALAHGGRR